MLYKKTLEVVKIANFEGAKERREGRVIILSSNICHLLLKFQ